MKSLIFHCQWNFFSQFVIKQLDQRLPLSDRQKSAVYDAAFSLIPTFPLLPVAYLESRIFHSSYLSTIIVPCLFIAMFMIKDSLYERSIGKCLAGFKIIDSGTNESINLLQSVIRNITILIWPLEILILLGTPEIRMGDFFGRTKVVSAKKLDPMSLIGIESVA